MNKSRWVYLLCFLFFCRTLQTSYVLVTLSVSHSFVTNKSRILKTFLIPTKIYLLFNALPTLFYIYSGLHNHSTLYQPYISNHSLNHSQITFEAFTPLFLSWKILSQFPFFGQCSCHTENAIDLSCNLS